MDSAKLMLPQVTILIAFFDLITFNFNAPTSETLYIFVQMPQSLRALAQFPYPFGQYSIGPNARG